MKVFFENPKTTGETPQDIRKPEIELLKFL